VGQAVLELQGERVEDGAHLSMVRRLGDRKMVEFTLSVLVSGGLLAVGSIIGIILAVWIHEKHRLKIEDANRRAYLEARSMEVKRINMENDRRLKAQYKYAETTITPEEEQKSYEESLRMIGYTDEEIADQLKSRRRM